MLSNPIDRLGKVTFIPVLFQPGGMGVLKDKKLSFWLKNSIYEYPYCLVNAHHHKKKVTVEMLEEFLPETVVFADSGGLQAVTLKAGKPNIEELTLWQQKHSHIGFGFDELPFITDRGKLTGWEFDNKNFLDYAKRSAKNLDIALCTRTNDNFKIYGIVQGRKFEEYKKWFDVIKCDVDGYCVKAPSNNPINVAESALFAYYNVDKPLHFLGMSSLSKALVIYYFSKYFKHKITFDSSTYCLGSKFRTFVSPIFCLKIRYVKPDVEKEDFDDRIIFENPYDLSFCGCPICSFLSKEEFKELHISNDTRLGGFIDMHNLVGMLKLFNFAEQICQSKAAMSQFVRSLFKAQTAERVVDAFDMIDEGVSKGYDFISKKYSSLLSSNIDVVKQTSILDF